MSQPRMKRRCRSISSCPLEGKRQRLSSTIPSITNDDTTHDATSTRTVVVDMGTRKSSYSAHHSGRYDNEDRMASEPPGPRVFSRAIRSTPLPSPFRPPTGIAKYNSETKPELWLADFRLACQLGGARGDVRYFKRKQKNPQAHGYRCSLHSGVFQSIDFPQRT